MRRSLKVTNLILPTCISAFIVLLLNVKNNLKLVTCLGVQMCGRAGRPPFDDTGMVIIMTRRETVRQTFLPFL